MIVRRLLCVGVLIVSMIPVCLSQETSRLDYDSLMEADFEKAATYITTLICDHPGCVDFHVKSLRKYGSELSKRHRYDSSTSTYEKSLRISNDDAGPVYRLIAINYLLKADYGTAKSYLRKALKENVRVADYHEQGRSLNLLGVINKREGNLDSALVNYDKAAKAYAMVNNQEEVASGMANIYKNQGNIYHNLGMYEQALKSHTKALQVEEPLNLEDGLRRTYLNISNVYRALGMFETFRNYLEKAIALANELGEKQTLAIGYNNLGNHYAEDLENDSSKLFYQKSLAISGEISDLYYKALAHQNLGNFYRDHHQFDSARYHFNESLLIRESVGDKRGRLATLSNLGGLYVLEGDPRAEEVLLNAMEEAKQLKYYDLEQDALIFLVDFYKKQGLYDLALNYYEALSVAKDSLNNQDFYNRISAVETQFAVSTYQNQLEIKETELAQNSKINKLLIAVILLFTGIVGFLVFFFYKLKNYSTRLEEKNTKIDTLMRELHHRVKNNLQVISSLLGLQSMRLEDEKAKKAVEDGKSRVRAMSLIHQRLYKQEDATSINAKEYIQNLLSELTTTYGYHGKITTELDLADINLDVDRTLPLGLILNELISNSFKYAYQDIDKPILKLQLVTEDRKGKLTISDNGKGFQTPLNVQEAKSFGLRLVNILTEQLKGTLQVSYQNGLKYELDFNLD